MCSSVPVLQFVGKLILGQRQGAGSCERHWKEYKDIRTSTKNRMKTDTVEKLIVVRTSLLLEKDSLMEWRTEMNKFSDKDEFIKFDDSITKSFNYRVLKFFNYTEEW